MTNIAIIVGAGKGTRMKQKINKILLPLLGEPIICHTIKKFEDCSEIDKIIVVANKDDAGELNNLIKKNRFRKINKIVEGGIHRQDSVYNGLKAVENVDDEDIILIHNAANPFITQKMITELIIAAKEYDIAIAGFPAEDTIKEVEGNFITKTLDRKRLWQAQTPQVMKYGLAVKAFENAYKKNFYGTDDSSLVEKLGKKVRIIECPKENIKITTQNDLLFAEKPKTCLRIGIGLDSHKFTDKKKPLVLGGVIIPNEDGLEANSDGDVILHSLFNALSQSIGDKSLGYYADPMCKQGITNSREYLKVILGKIEERGYRINNVGIMIEAKKPRIGIYEEKIKESIAVLCKIKKEQIGITATSGEELTPFGKGFGIQVFSVVAVSRKQTTS